MQNILEKQLFESVEKNTPEYVKHSTLPDLTNPDEFVFRLKREYLYHYDKNTNPEGLNLNVWLENYAKEAAVSTAGIRGPQNILYPWDTRFPINAIGIILATKAKALNLKEKYPDKKLVKLAGREVRYNSKLYLDLISRVQAAEGIETLVTSKGQTMPIWLASFLIYKLDLAGGEYITSSHGISVKNATKDLNSQGSQYLPEESAEFVAQLRKIFKKVEEEGFYDIKIASANNPLINKKYFEEINDGLDLYTEYLRSGAACEENIELIKGVKNKIIIENVGGSAYETLSKILKRLDIDEKYDWFDKEEDAFFAGIGKYDTDPKGNKTFYDYSVDATVTKKDKDGKVFFPVIETMGYREKLKNYPVNTMVLITDPDHDRLTVCRLESATEKSKAEKLGIDFIDLGNERILTVLSANKAFLLMADNVLKLLQERGKFGNHERFMIKTTASAKSWDEWAKHNGIKVVNVPVGFKEIASVMRKVEAKIARNENNVTVSDVFGNEISLGKSPRLIFGGEESGGMITGPDEPIVSTCGRKAVAMREKSATEAIMIASCLERFMEDNKLSLSDALEKLYADNEIKAIFDTREDVTYYNESEPDIAKLNEAKKAGEKLRTANDLFFLSTALAKREGIISVDNAKEILSSTFKNLNFENLKDIIFVGDGTYMLFEDKFVEIRPSGTDAKTKAYGSGANKNELDLFCKTLGNYGGEKNAVWNKYISEDFYENSKKLSSKIYEEYAIKDTEGVSSKIPDVTIF